METFLVWANNGYPGEKLDEGKFGKCSAFRGDCCRLQKGDKIHLVLNYESAGAKNQAGDLGMATVKKVHYSVAFSPNKFKSEIQQIVYMKFD